MPADTHPSALPDSRPLFRLIRRTRRLLRSTWVATGLGLTAGLLLGALAVLAALDLLVPLESALGSWAVTLDPGLRLAGLLLIVVPAALAFLQGVVRPLLRRLGPTQVARRIESHMPGIHNRLVSAIDLQGRDAAKASPVFLRRLLTEALERIKGFRPSRVLDLLSLRRAALLAGVAVGAFGLCSWAFADRMPTALARLLMPFADIPPASGVAYDVRPGAADVLRDEEIAFSARVTKGDPQTLRLELYGGKAPAHKYELKPDRNDPTLWKATVDAGSLGAGYEKGFHYRVFGGGTWSKRYAINLVERPVLVRVDTGVRYPAYMRIPQLQPTAPQAREVTGPEGGKVEVTVQGAGDVAVAEVQLLEPALRPIPREKQQERAWFEDKLPVGAGRGGTWSWQTVDKRLVHTEPAALGTHAHWFHNDPVGVAVGKGDVLFAYVKLPADQKPEAVMLEWHDGDGWEHRAFWGADRIREGRPGTPSRYRAGELPRAGEWVRLEVPAEKVGLEGKTLRGLAFKMHGGTCLWGRTGTVQVTEPSVRVIKTYAMENKGDERWTGRFPLTGTGTFRVELRSKAGHPSKPMEGLRYVALPDRPPYVSLERQSTDLVLSKPGPVQLNVTAFDDYGLDEVRLLVRPGTGSHYQARTLKSLARPARHLNLLAALTESADLKLGEQLRYTIEARDTKGQTTRTPEYVVRIAADPNAADKQFDNFDRAQDTFQDRLAKLIADQKKVQAGIDKANKEYAALTEKIKAREEEAASAEGSKVPDKSKPQDTPQVKLTPEEAKRLAELQKELAKLAGDEQRNAGAAQKISDDLKKSAEDAGKLEMMPRPLVNQMKSTQSAFDKLVAKAMRDLGKRLGDGADPKKGTPDLKDLKDRGDRLGKELAAMKGRLDALSKARKGLREDLQKAMAALREKMLKEDGKLSARELEALRDYIARLRKQLERMKGRQDDLRKDAEDSADPRKAKLKQEDLEKELERLLADVKRLLNKKRKDRDVPEFPDSPYRDDKEEKVAPKEEDTDEPLPTKEKPGKKGKKTSKKGKKDPKDKDEEEDEPKYMPRLGGPKPKIDPRYAKKRRPVKRSPKKGDKDADAEQRADLADRQDEKSRDLDSAEKSLASDQSTLEQMIRQLNQAARAKGKSKEGDSDSDPLDALRQMLNSARMREALAMAAQARRSAGRQPAPSRTRGPRPSTPNDSDEGAQEGAGDGPGTGNADLAKLDPTLRAMILKMPPSRTREELIRGLNEQGPEAYRAFIEDYFKRLTKTKTAPKK
jgi:hypothetical protein